MNKRKNKKLAEKKFNAALDDDWEKGMDAACQEIFDEFTRPLLIQAVLAEREACARICDAEAIDPHESDPWTGCAQYLANNIRARITT